MFFEPGFFGTRAALYMDAVTLYFALLPLLVMGAIALAMRRQYAAHYLAQMGIFALTLVVVVVFEVGVRISGGFLEYVKSSEVHYGFMVTFLVLHILVAIATVAAWAYLIYAARRAYRADGPDAFAFTTHKTLGRRVFAGILLTSVMGVSIYIFLFAL
jgi:putative membrane protein